MAMPSQPTLDDLRRMYEQLKRQKAAQAASRYMPPSASQFDPFAAPSQPVIRGLPPDASPGDIVEYAGRPSVIVAMDIGDPRVVVIEYEAGWDRGTPNGRYVPPDWIPVMCDRYYLVSQNDLIMVRKAAPKAKPKPKLDLTQLDKLVVTDVVMREIKAVLKQHEHSGKMFEEWGLGEVVQYGRGMTFLFYGPPGTGKTWAANCIAKAFAKDLLTIGAAEIQTSEPGGANRNIQQAFGDAKKSGKILFIDECDSLITSRNDVGMILGGEINTLLTEIEKTDGVVILATNRIENLDEALERRISLIVEFPEPDYDQRVKIWQVLLPKKLPLAKVITPEKLAEWKLTGGQIKNVLLQSARLALADKADKVEVHHVEAAVERIIKSKSLMGTASRYRQIAVREDFKRGAGA